MGAQVSDELGDFIPPARVRRDGISCPYVPNEQFKGSGFMRSCGKCGAHRLQGGGRIVRPWGWVASCCIRGRG